MRVVRSVANLLQSVCKYSYARRSYGDWCDVVLTALVASTKLSYVETGQYWDW